MNQTAITSVPMHIQNICKSFGDHEVLKQVNIEIQKGEFFTLLGSSGCGKTTLLRCIAGFEKPTSGTIEYKDGADQQMGFVFQDSVLLPWKMCGKWAFVLPCLPGIMRMNMDAGLLLTRRKG